MWKDWTYMAIFPLYKTQANIKPRFKEFTIWNFKMLASNVF